MNSMKKILTAILFFLLIPLSAGEKTGSVIDWQRGIITAYGIASVRINDEGKPISAIDNEPISLNLERNNAYERAREIALENLISAIKSIQVEETLYMADMLKKYEYTRERLDRNINSLPVNHYPVDFYRSGCKIQLTIGDLISVFPYSYPREDFPRCASNPIQTEYTGLIIDTRGLDIEPMIFPVIFNSEGLEIYNRYYINISNAVRYGMVSYVHSEDEALKNKRIGDRPYYTVALKKNRGCPVLSEKDVRKIFSSEKTIVELQKCKVIFIIDRDKTK